MNQLLIRKIKRGAAPAAGGGGGGAPTDVPGPAGSASFSVAWDAPAHDEGGTAGPGGGAADVAGYVVDYATSSQTPTGTYPYRKVFTGAGTVSGSVSSIASGTYYLRMASYDSEGNVGNYGPEITKVAA